MGNKLKFNRKSHRLKFWDYRKPATYLITICTENKRPFFDHKQMKKIANKYIKTIPERNPHVKLDEYIIMPNHIHLILNIICLPYSSYTKPYPDSDQYIEKYKFNDNVPKDNSEKKVSVTAYNLPGSLGAVIGGFKSITKRCIRYNEKFKDFSWQRDFWDHIIRNEEELIFYRKYIRENPKKASERSWD